jgi:hypothetical protein
MQRPSFRHENQHFRENQAKTIVFIPNLAQRHWYQLVLEEICARRQRPSFGHENQHFRENQAKTLVFIPNFAQRHQYQLVLEEIRLGG